MTSMPDRPARPYIAAVIPARNEEAALGTTVARVSGAIEAAGADAHVIVVDDGSTDRTWQVIQSLSAKSPGAVRGVRLSRNFGKDAAIIAGLTCACEQHFHAAITIDADGQHPPDVIPGMVGLWREGSDIVNGIKASRLNDSLVQRLLAAIFNLVFTTLTKLDFANASDFKLLDRRAVESILTCGDHDIFYRALVAWIGYKQSFVPFAVAPASRTTRWTPAALIKLVVSGIVMFSDIPVYFVLASGLGALALSFVLIGILLFRYFAGGVPSGYPTLLVLQITTLSLTVAAIGAIGLYVRATLAQSRGRPRYIVRATATGQQDER